MTATETSRDVVYLTELEDVSGDAFTRKHTSPGTSSPFDSRVDMLALPENQKKWKWVAVYGNRDTAGQTASRLRKRYPGVVFQRGEHPSGKTGVAGYYDPAVVEAANQEPVEEDWEYPEEG